MDSPTTSYSMTSAEGEIQPNQIGTIIVIDNLVYRDHPSLKLRGVPKDVRSHDIERVRNKENSIRHYRRLHVSMVLHQDQLRRVRQMSTRLHRRLYAFSITGERLLDLDKEYGMKKWCDVGGWLSAEDMTSARLVTNRSFLSTTCQFSNLHVGPSSHNISPVMVRMKPGIYLTRTNVPSLGGNTLAPAGDKRLEALVLTGWGEACVRSPVAT
uniref:DUF1263 domain-containing protein n=1 Tax=Oryza sativa subsp. japonica TaxID=39947 RepID=Q6YUJ9_ORYSJ|nr:hypothetical protein [Oryza sativa Japonica Group]